MMKAAEQDYGYAQFKMGDYYFFGCGPCLEDNKKAMNSTWSFGGQNGDKRLQKSVL